MKLLFTVTLISFMTFGFAQQLTHGIIFGENINEPFNERALNFYTAEIEQNPSSAEPLIYRSELYKSLGKFDLAEQDLQKALLLNPFARIYKSREYRMSLFPIKKYGYFTEISNEKNLFEKSFILKEQYQLISTLESISTNDSLIINQVIEALFNKEISNASYNLESLSNNFKTHPLYFDLLGAIELKKGNLEESITHFNTAIDLNPDFIIPYYNRAIAFKKLNEYEKAEKDMIRALEINDQIAKIHFGKGKLMQLKGENQKAQLYYEKALTLDEYYSEAALNYSSLLKREGQFIEAMIEIEEAINKDPNNYINYYVRGGLFFIFGDYHSAIKDFDKYLSFNLDDNEALFFRGVCKTLSDQNTDGCDDIRYSINNGYNNKNLELYFAMCD